MERYNVPGNIEISKFLIQSRVIAFLKEWLEIEPEDMDSALLRKIQKFAKDVLPQDGHENQSKNLVSIIEKKFNKRQTMPVTKINVPVAKVLKTAFFLCLFLKSPSTRVSFKISPTRFILEEDLECIAKELTFIEFNLYCAIRVKNEISPVFPYFKAFRTVVSELE